MPVLYEAAPADSPSRLHRLLRQPPDCTPSLLCSPADTIFRYRGRIGFNMKQKARKIKSFFAALAMTLTAVTQMPHIGVFAANTYRKFDFGGSGAASG